MIISNEPPNRESEVNQGARRSKKKLWIVGVIGSIVIVVIILLMMDGKGNFLRTQVNAPINTPNHTFDPSTASWPASLEESLALYEQLSDENEELQASFREANERMGELYEEIVWRRAAIDEIDETIRGLEEGVYTPEEVDVEYLTQLRFDHQNDIAMLQEEFRALADDLVTSTTRSQELDQMLYWLNEHLTRLERAQQGSSSPSTPPSSPSPQQTSGSTTAPSPPLVLPSSSPSLLSTPTRSSSSSPSP